MTKVDQEKIDSWATKTFALLEQYHKDVQYVARMTGFTYAVDRSAKVLGEVAELRREYDALLKQ